MFGRKVQERAIAQVAQIDFVKHAVEEVWSLLHFSGHGVERDGHPLAVVPLRNDHHVVIVAECIEVLLPPLLARLVGADEIVPLRAVFELVIRDVDGGQCEQ